MHNAAGSRWRRRSPDPGTTHALDEDPAGTQAILDWGERAEGQPSLRELAIETQRPGGQAAEAAAERLMGRIHQLSLRYARARLGRFGAEDAAQDVAQEVCMAVHTALPSYDERGLPFEAFIYTIAARKVADAQRWLIRAPRPVADIPDSADPGGSPERTALVRDEAQRVMALLRTLPAQQQEIITLRVAVGMSTEETGAALGMSAGAIRVAQHRALTRLRQLVADQTGEVAS